ncbi:DNA-protecting protein DprA [Stenotrophomonas tumulicola]|uniref:DNA-protecting protein DprA n=2 Tax=Stenotrophomonas tumulicola TaxID=1685415 RepID=A0A7W3FKR5_9GAMM|nr:DNA-processing protein DprA [Stenotrophomonas tumulicola]MBA8681392.1 DNA-protecting protein DprA [Stenotrophomonas tumulicola]
MRMNADTVALLTLILAGGSLAPRRALARSRPTLASAINAGPVAWRQAGCSAAQQKRLAAPDHALLETGLDWLQRPDHHLLALDDPRFPPLLHDIPEPPLALFIHGDPSRLWLPAVAVVGSRSPTPSGRALAAEFSRAFAQAGMAVVSGLAAGIDAAAHQAVLEVAGVTVAVIGNGPDSVYPPHHRRLQASVAALGAVASEYPPGTPARPAYFPARNRLVAGLSLVTVVIEAANRSGALITARLAAEAGREVCALPGSVRNPRAAGCHRLIRDGAALVETPDEVLALVAPALAHSLPALQKHLHAPTEQGRRAHLPASLASEPDYQNLWKALDHDPTPMDSLITRCGLTAARLSSMLLAMELAGIVVCEHGRYCRNPGFPTSTASLTQAEGQ